MPPRSNNPSAAVSSAARRAGGAAAAGGGAGAGGAGGVRSRSVMAQLQRFVVAKRAPLSVALAFAIVVAVSIWVAPPVRPQGWRSADDNAKAAGSGSGAGGGGSTASLNADEHEIWVKQRKNNRDTLRSWNSFATHRSNCTSRIATQIEYAAEHTAPLHRVEPGVVRVLVLGAGNVNDLDLRQLLSHPSRPRLHLVDVDLDALDAGVDRQLGASDAVWSADGKTILLPAQSAIDDALRARITTQRVDLTGVWELVKEWPIQPPAAARGGRPRPQWFASKGQSSDPASDEQVQEVVDALERSPAIDIRLPSVLAAAAAAGNDLATPAGRAAAEADASRFDIVVSTCVLSQIIAGLYDGLTLGVTPQELSMRLVMAIRAHHVGVVNAHLVPGGLGLIITDMVSTLTFPKMLRLSGSGLTDAMADLIEEENFFHGTNPHRLLRDVQVTHGARVAAGSVQVLNPWLWHFNDSKPPRTYLVYAIGWRTLTIDADPIADSELTARQQATEAEIARLNREQEQLAAAADHFREPAQAPAAAGAPTPAAAQSTGQPQPKQPAATAKSTR